MNRNRQVPRVAVIGPGAMGCLMAARLARASVPVILVDHNPERAHRLDSDGIEVETGEGRWRSRPEVRSWGQVDGTFDLIFVMLKAYQTETALADMARIKGPETLFVSLQNGLGHHEILARIIAPEKIVLGTATTGANKSAAGNGGPWNLVRLVSDGSITIGMAPVAEDGYDARRGPADFRSLALVASILRKAGFPVEEAHEIMPHVWRKLLVNVGINAITALCGLRNGEVHSSNHARRVMEMAVTEAYAVGRATGAVEMDPSQAVETCEAVCRQTADNLSSMLQDRLKGSLTEIDFINGAVCRIGAGLGMETPVNRTLVELVKACQERNWMVAGRETG